jgi:predicted nucleic acid-binding protein
MDAFRERLAEHAIVGLDTGIFIYHFDDHPRYRRLTGALLAAVQAGRPRAITSTVTIMELTVHPCRLNRPAVARQYEVLVQEQLGGFVTALPVNRH